MPTETRITRLHRSFDRAVCYPSRSTMSRDGSNPPAGDDEPSEPSESQTPNLNENELLSSEQNALSHSPPSLADTLCSMSPNAGRMHALLNSKFKTDISSATSSKRLKKNRGIAKAYKKPRQERNFYPAYIRIRRYVERLLGDVANKKLRARTIERRIKKLCLPLMVTSWSRPTPLKIPISEILNQTLRHPNPTTRKTARMTTPSWDPT
ncbi:hypothetical protein GCK72_015657 [Caenorhabditis remanei]|uniref:Uncharacterized protein n=1 Tax=Caenorhabditis remanei TaxID=31234 RepID=A0A6A5GX55_CAERE|nr:hypothetical protein GCK72_015657 [Caenorhabditis remanei]KAF1759196.1 hypothetical protein GCK72_015657 [Caenorhabditis remanei]